MFPVLYIGAIFGLHIGKAVVVGGDYQVGGDDTPQMCGLRVTGRPCFFMVSKG